jgi:hypothetical protein
VRDEHDATCPGARIRAGVAATEGCVSAAAGSDDHKLEVWFSEIRRRPVRRADTGRIFSGKARVRGRAVEEKSVFSKGFWWAHKDSNLGPAD